MTEHEQTAGATPPAADGKGDIYQRLGEITRQLHEALKELGYMPALKDAVGELPDARSRLEYIARLTGEAAEKVLNRVDEAKAEQQTVIEASRQLVDTIGNVPGLKWAMPELLEWSHTIQAAAERTDQHLTEIMLAQDFHDLTGQVIKKVVALAGTLEQQLVQLLVETAAHAGEGAGATAPAPEASARRELSGPVVNPEGRSDVVTSQQQVDDLLASLGF
ncbi:MAG: protein phosphatase CheZ [Tepidimonas ignava]|uniref:Protein phosphatase CheZ n=1 Tax=Tepidimonas ignava TaxID=114249 RepID=A0A4R3LDB9_9BURK|nr:protein phosphatase CheZ [Tepidimonas ignava]MCX7814762.1 protein phosphatase CheZ [Tepidimonas ignava]TCS96274.1 chemotaxis phosphatase CheZ [Tepidimonas ignava]TSE23619.1 Chemotaxis phosphatase, CheZ [Tepidimonas ignava]